MGHFWKDKQSPFDSPGPATKRFFSVWWSVMNIVLGFVAAATIALVFDLIGKPLLYAWLALCLFIPLNVIRAWRRARAEAGAISTMQENGYRLTGASLMGSANHVAGHPRLDRDQRVLLAVVGSSLRICSFDAPEPLDEIRGAAISKLELVVYDDERIPRTDAIDPAAQALQITFDRGADASRCLFNRMVDHRPIDWFHELDKARISSA